MSTTKWFASVTVPDGKPFRVGAKMKTGKPYRYVTFMNVNQFKQWLADNKSAIVSIKVK